MSQIGEQTLMRYADGELGAVRRTEVEQALLEDPRLRARLDRDRRLLLRLAAHYDAVESEAVPPRLAALAMDSAASANPSRRLWQGAAAVAGLLMLAWAVSALA